MSRNTHRPQTFSEDRPCGNYIQNYQHFTTSPIAHYPHTVSASYCLPSYAHLSRGSSAFAPSSCLAFQGCVQNAIMYPGYNIYGESLPMMNSFALQYPQYQTYYHYEPPCPPINGQQPYQFINQPLFLPSPGIDQVAGQTVPFSQATRGSHFNNRAQIPPSLCINENGGFQGFYVSDPVYGTTSKDTGGLTLYAEEKHMTLQFSKVPRHGDVFRCQQVGNVLTLDFVSKENPRENQSVLSSEYPTDRSLYRVHEGKKGLLLLMMGADNKLAFPEESRTFTYCLLDKWIILNFNRLPRDGDIFCSGWMNRVMTLYILPNKNSQEHHNLQYSGYPGNLYRIQEGNDGLLLIKMDKNEIIYPFGGTTHDKNRYFTYYLPNVEIAFHFERLPADGDIVCSQLSNNSMFLERFPPETDQDHHNLQSGNPRERNFYRVKQGDAGFVLVKIAYSDIPLTYHDVKRLQLKLRVCIASSTNLDEEDHLCSICLDAYKNDDIIVSLGCGHDYHTYCIMTWLQRKDFCPICRKGVINK